MNASLSNPAAQGNDPKTRKLTRRDFLKVSGFASLGLALTSCGMVPTEEPMTEFGEESPFGIYSPYGEFSIDRGTFASVDDISALVKDIGVSWVQELPPFLAVDVVPPEINLYSRIGREAGMKPPMIRNPLAIENYRAELSQTITTGIDRYRYLEVDTEPDGIGGWQNDPEGYVQLLRISHEVVKGISPDCRIMFGGLSGGQEVLDTQGATFLEKALTVGAAEFIDGIEFKRHHFSTNNYALLKDHYNRIGEILQRYGVDIHAIPVFVETAHYDGDPRDPAPHSLIEHLPIQTEAEQAGGLVRTYVYAIALGIKKIFWNLVYERSDYEPGHTVPFAQNPFNHYGLIHNPTNADGFSHKKLAFYTYKKMVEILDGSDWGRIQIIQAAENVRVYRFGKGGKTIHVAWWDYFNDPAYAPGTTKDITLTDLESLSSRITEAVPAFASGDKIVDQKTAFTTKTVGSLFGKLTLTLGESPLYIES